MPAGKSCYACKHTKAQDPYVHMHQFPKDSKRRQQWCQALNIDEKDLPKDARICTRHFQNGDATNLPSLTLGKRFASPKKRPAPVRLPLPPRKVCKQGKRLFSSSASCSPSLSVLESDNSSTVTAGEIEPSPSTTSTSSANERSSDIQISSDLQITVNAAVMARIEMLEHENTRLKHLLDTASKKPFRLEDIAHDDRLVRAYTGFPSYEVLLNFWGR